ncbi:MAG: hypothetical protein M0Z42_04275 [Actinomycetota bacterium]|jgi:hypothetical protein|nr:hypothetical protein [Actinomycetota bacterium]
MSTYSPDLLAKVVHVVDMSNAVDLLEEGMLRSSRGRRSNHTTLRLFFIGGILSTTLHGSGVIEHMHKVLVEELPLDVQWRLGVRQWVSGTDGQHKERCLTLDDFYNLSRRLAKYLDYGIGSAPDLDDDERARRHSVVQTVCDTFCAIFDDPDITASAQGWISSVVAIDATGIWSWGRGSFREPEPGAAASDEPGAAASDEADEAAPGEPEGNTVCGAGTGDEDAVPAGLALDVTTMSRAGDVGGGHPHDPDARPGKKTRKDGAKEGFFGYEEHTTVRASLAPSGDPAWEPPLIRSFEVTPASTDVVDVSLGMLDRCAPTPEDIIVDRHYSYKDVFRWKDQLTARGIRQHLDLRGDEQGFIDVDQVKFAAGWAHCPATPADLGTIVRPQPTASKETIDRSIKRIELRQRYAFRRITTPDASGRARWECPASAGTVGCPNCPGTVAAAISLGLPVIENPPALAGPNAPACCTQRTVTITPPALVRKLMQPFYWGSKQWREIFGKRTYVEGSYGNRKNPSTENLRRGYLRVTGVARVNLFSIFPVVSYNLRMLQNWHDRTGLGNPDHPLLAKAPQSFGFKLLTEAESQAIGERFLEAKAS